MVYPVEFSPGSLSHAEKKNICTFIRGDGYGDRIDYEITLQSKARNVSNEYIINDIYTKTPCNDLDPDYNIVTLAMANDVDNFSVIIRSGLDLTKPLTWFGEKFETPLALAQYMLEKSKNEKDDAQVRHWGFVIDVILNKR
jgi:hypothetical protein